nr:winged helix-turn-helix domain-containing protein [Bradyrhizobium sp. dw_78]
MGSRALDILIALVERAGELVNKRELIRVVWPDTVVVEANLTVHVAALRRALGDGQHGNRYIVNVPGRGYRFIASVTFAEEPETATLSRDAPARRHNLPIQLTRLIGRADIVDDLVDRLSTARLLTLAGPAGIGKTAVALEVGERLIGTFEHGIWLVDLAPLDNPLFVQTVLASSLKLEIRSDNPLPSMVGALSDKQMLLIFDNCEHLIEEASAVAAAILRGAGGVRILATSREPLRIDGEQVCRLSPLQSPPESRELSADEALGFSAVQLFVERAAAAMNDFQLADSDASSAAYICRTLDGIPLAIEFAAPRVDIFGVNGLAARLDDRLPALGGGHRGAMPRHHTISAALDWSYRLLDPDEQKVFRRLAIFVGSFTLEAARAVVADTGGSSPDIADTVASLVTKSLVTAGIGEGGIRFHLLVATRAYAFGKLLELESDRIDALRRRHAACYRDLLESARGVDIRSAMAAGKPEIDNVRAALGWAFTREGDPSIAVALAAASAPLLLEMSLLAECHSWTGKALDLLEEADRGSRLEMVLQMEFGLALMYTLGVSAPARAALMRASELAESLGDVGYLLRALAGLTNLCLRLEDFRGALSLAQRAEPVANSMADPVQVSTAEFLLSGALVYLGEYARSMNYAKQAFTRMKSVQRPTPVLRSGMDRGIQARVVFANILWLQVWRIKPSRLPE